MSRADGMLAAQLRRGRLTLDIERQLMPAEELFGFAERRNPKRAFLFVSRVLGRHIPVSPRRMEASYRLLAEQIPTDLPQPLLVIGMAETAVGLAAGVHRALARRGQRGLYMISTRHPLGSPLLAEFEEAHSHATDHLLHQPVDPVAADCMQRARTLLLVDDEASTGATLINLARALLERLPRVQEVVMATLTDWSGGALAAALPVPVRAVSLLSGRFHWRPDDSAPAAEMPEVNVSEAGEWPLDGGQDWGRLGVFEHCNPLAAKVPLPARGERILVLGSGEFVWQPFLLAEHLQQAGADVLFSATSRSPIALGHAIRHALSFQDNYGLGIPNFLYNVEPRAFDRIYLCSETPAAAVDPRLLQALGAEVISYAD